MKPDTLRRRDLFKLAGAAAVAALEEFARGSKWDLISPVVEAHCSPTDKDLDDCRQLGLNLAKTILAKGP
ncbi:MAG: hypothetical protein MUP47_05255 [Phycisphaerae bacterium]|nr:hypothetical protein [Phycisphaerae bacterium]